MCIFCETHYNDVIMSMMAPQITSLTIVYPTIYSGASWWHQSSASLAFARGIHRWPVNSPHKGPVTRKMFLFDDVIMRTITVHVYIPFNWSNAARSACLDSLSPGDRALIKMCNFQMRCYVVIFISRASPALLQEGGQHKTLLMISQYWFW